MKRVPLIVWALLIVGAAYLLFEYGIAPLTEAITDVSAPLPSSLVLLYTGMTAIGVLLYLSVREDRWHRFLHPLADFLARPGTRFQKALRIVVLVGIPALLGWRSFESARGQSDPPVDPPGIHFSLPNEYSALTNPFGSYSTWKPEDVFAGGVLYTKNCAMCHGDAQDGKGLFARAWQPRPANFRDEGTIAQLPENYLFWRIKTGAPGLPTGSIKYRSTMPAWADVLTDEEIWQVILFEYTNAGKKPARRE